MRLTHPASGRTVETDERYVDMYRSQGWVEAAPEAPRRIARKATPPPPDESSSSSSSS